MSFLLCDVQTEDFDERSSQADAAIRSCIRDDETIANEDLLVLAFGTVVAQGEISIPHASELEIVVHRPNASEPTSPDGVLVHMHHVMLISYVAPGMSSRMFTATCTVFVA